MEELGLGDVEPGVGQIGRRNVAAFYLIAGVEPGAAEGNCKDGARGLHTGEFAQAVDELLIEGLLLRARISIGHVGAKTQHTVAAIAGIDTEKTNEGLHEETRADKKNHRSRHLADDENGAKARVSSA